MFDMQSHKKQPLSDDKHNNGYNQNLPVPNDKNKYLFHSNLGLKLCADLIKTGDKNNKIQQILNKIETTITHDFLELTRDADNAEAAHTYTQLLALFEQVVEASSFPNLQMFNTVAVGGQFSAGKSKFLNSVLGCDSLLPTDTTPTTSIPTYINKGNTDTIYALNKYQNKVEIDEAALKAISHAFNKEYNVTFSHILQLINVQQQSFKYPKLTFLDTPGYSKSDNLVNKNDNTDENIAREHLRTTDYLIWLVDSQNGTIPTTDLEFIKELQLEQPILFVISKADKRTESELISIVETAKKDLHKNNIKTLNVIAYSAVKKKEYQLSSKEQPSVLSDFLESISIERGGTPLVWQAKRILQPFIDEITREKEFLKGSQGLINDLMFSGNLNEDQSIKLKYLSNRTKQQRDIQVTSEKLTKDLSQLLIDQLSDLCSSLNLKILDTNNTIKLKTLSNESARSTSSILKFEANLKVSSKEGLKVIKSLKGIDGKIGSISAVGVKIITNYADLEIFIPKFSIKKETEQSDLNAIFNNNKKVLINITSDKTCIVQYHL